MRRARCLLAAILVVTVGSSRIGWTHEAEVGMATETLILKTSGKRKLVFKGFSGTLTPAAAEHPTEVGSSVLVLADGVDGAGRSATYNNGVAANGSPDVSTVRRRSVTPSNGSPCSPVACVAGRVGAACIGAGDDAACDSTVGAGDGWCDACAITAGVTTEDEMFLLFGGYVLSEIE
jgi:hypothetical protein